MVLERLISEEELIKILERGLLDWEVVDRSVQQERQRPRASQ